MQKSMPGKLMDTDKYIWLRHLRDAEYDFLLLHISIIYLRLTYFSYRSKISQK